MPSANFLYRHLRGTVLGCKQVGVTGKPLEYTCVEPSSTSSPSGHLQMLEDLVSYSGSYIPFYSRVCTTNPRWAHSQTIMLHEHWHKFDTLASSQSFSTSFTGYSWRWGRSGNETIVMWDVCKWEKVVVWNSNVPCNSLTLAPQCTAFPTYTALQLLKVGVSLFERRSTVEAAGLRGSEHWCKTINQVYLALVKLFFICRVTGQLLHIFLYYI